MSYKNKASASRDALFGSASGSGGGGPKHKKNAAANRDALFGGAAAPSGKESSGASTGSRSQSRPTTTTTSTSTAAPYRPTTSEGYTGPKKKANKVGSVLSPEAKVAKQAEAEENREKANKAMQKTLFGRPDPVAASTYYKRAAECYQALGDAKLERMHRVSSGQCNFQIGAWASAATDYTRAAELAFEAEDLGDYKQMRREAYNYHKRAAEAWTQMNEKSKAAASQVQAALALNFGEEGTMLSKDALAGIEEAVESHVPDVFNPYARYRQTGHSAFVDPDSEETLDHPTQETIALANEHLVSRAYSHEPLLELVYTLVGFGEYASALYACGAATTILERDGVSTLSLSRVFVMETILTLAMGDPIAAEQQFLKRHVQKTAYLSSRECKLAEDLFRAVKMRDADALEEARSPTGSNRAGLANLNEAMRVLVGQLRISGVARKTVADTTTYEKPKKSKDRPSEGKKKGQEESKEDEERPPPPSLQELMDKKTGYEDEAAEGANLDSNVLASELDDLDFGDEEEELDDDDLDLR